MGFPLSEQCSLLRHGVGKPFICTKGRWRGELAPLQLRSLLEGEPMGFEDLEIDSLTRPQVAQEVFAPLCVSASPSWKAPGVMYVRVCM